MHASFFYIPRSCPFAQPMLSVVFTDVWPPSMDSCSSPLVHTPPVHFVGPLHHLLGLVHGMFHPGVLSMLCNTTHVKTMTLTTFYL